MRSVTWVKEGENVRMWISSDLIEKDERFKLGLLNK